MDNVDTYCKQNRGSETYTLVEKILSYCSHLLWWGPEEQILDVGCGPGDVTTTVLMAFLPHDFRSLLGIDVSHSMVSHAQKIFSRDRVNFALLDIESDISKNNNYFNRFDKIFSFFVLHWIFDLEKCMNNLYSLVSPGGQALLFFPVDRRFQKTYQQVRSMKKWNGYFKEVQRCIPPSFMKDPKKEFEVVVLKAGFKIQMIKLDILYTEFDNLESFTALVESLDPDICHVPLTLKYQYLADCVRLIQDNGALQADGTHVTLSQRTLLCVLQK